jgi:hypothetical protein
MQQIKFRYHRKAYHGFYECIRFLLGSLPVHLWVDGNTESVSEIPQGFYPGLNPEPQE